MSASKNARDTALHKQILKSFQQGLHLHLEIARSVDTVKKGMNIQANYTSHGVGTMETVFAIENFTQ